MKKNEGTILIIVALIGLIGTVAGSIIGVKWGKENITVVVQLDGKNIMLSDEDVQKMAEENEKLSSKISDYEKQIKDLESKSEDLASKLGTANGELSDVPNIEFQNYGLSIDGEEKTINKDKSFVSINGRQYYSSDFVDSLLPDNLSAIQKNDMIYIGRVIKEKSNLFDRQVINITDGSWVKIETNIKDTYGNMHDKAVTFSLSEHSATFNANKEYSKLKCTLAVLEGKEGGGIIQIESEQGVLFTSEEIASTDEPVVIDIPINQASKITIKHVSGTWDYVMVTDAVLYNEE